MWIVSLGYRVYLKLIPKCTVLIHIIIFPGKPSELTLNAVSKGEAVWKEGIGHEVGDSTALTNGSTTPLVDWKWSSLVYELKRRNNVMLERDTFSYSFHLSFNKPFFPNIVHSNFCLFVSVLLSLQTDSWFWAFTNLVIWTYLFDSPLATILKLPWSSLSSSQ